MLEGVQHILAEMIAESADVRSAVRNVLWDTGRLCTSKSDKLAEGQGLEYKDYFQFTEPVRHIPPHRILAINRGEKENALHVKLEWDAELGLRRGAGPFAVADGRFVAAVAGSSRASHRASESLAAQPTEAARAAVDGWDAGGRCGNSPTERRDAGPTRRDDRRDAGPTRTTDRRDAGPTASSVAGHRTAARGHHADAATGRGAQKHPHAEFLRQVTADALTRLLVPSLEREIRRELKMRAEDHAVSVFAAICGSKLLARAAARPARAGHRSRLPHRLQGGGPR